MIKPDGVHRALVGRIIERFEARGYKLVGIKVWPCSLWLSQMHTIMPAGHAVASYIFAAEN